MRRHITLLALGIIGSVWAFGINGCTNPSTPAGYVRYVTNHPITMPTPFYELQTEPTSTRLGWSLEVAHISVTPNTTTDHIVGPAAGLAMAHLHTGVPANLP